MASVSGAGNGVMRRKTVSAHNDATLRTVADFGEFGRVTLDEPVPHGGTGQGPSPLQAVLGALCGCEAVTFHRTAAGLGLRYESVDFEAAIQGRVSGPGAARASSRWASVSPYSSPVATRIRSARLSSPNAPTGRTPMP